MAALLKPTRRDPAKRQARSGEAVRERRPVHSPPAPGPALSEFRNGRTAALWAFSLSEGDASRAGRRIGGFMFSLSFRGARSSGRPREVAGRSRVPAPAPRGRGAGRLAVRPLAGRGVRPRDDCWMGRKYQASDAGKFGPRDVRFRGRRGTAPPLWFRAEGAPRRFGGVDLAPGGAVGFFRGRLAGHPAPSPAGAYTCVRTPATCCKVCAGPMPLRNCRPGTGRGGRHTALGAN